MNNVLWKLKTKKKFKIDTNYCDIHKECFIPNSTKFQHKGLGIVIGRGVKLGENVTVFQNVTIGGSGKRLVEPECKDNGYSVIEDNVILLSGCGIFGPITIGHDSIIGAGSVVLNNIPPYSLVVGVPGKVIKNLKVIK